MKKILIIYATYGSGHKSVANNIYEQMKNIPDVNVKLLDLTDYANYLGILSFKAFDFVIKHRSELLFNASYEMIDHKFAAFQQKRISRLFFDNKKIRNSFKDFQPDLLIATHYYGATLGVCYNQKKIINAKIMTILTDYKSHSEWLAFHKRKDAFIVPNDLVKEELLDYGVPAKKIFAYGIPLEKNKIANLDTRENIFKKYELDFNKKTILFFGGSSAGSLTYYEYFRVLVKEKFNANVIFISGKNEKLKNKANNYVKKINNKNIKVLGFTNDVYNLLSIADFVITKPGGATLTECIEFNTPLLLIPGFGGQEKYNTRYIKKMGFGYFSRTKIGFIKSIYRYLSRENHLNSIKNNLLKNKKIDSSKLISKLAVNLLKK